LSYASLWLLALVLVDAATVNNCSINDPVNPNTAQKPGTFSTVPWLERGTCTRRGSSADCYATLVAILSHLNPLHQAEYSGATTLLTLLPTIGALFGAPTTEIWTMLMIVPFGGWIALLVSFGGTMMPVRVEDYELDKVKGSSIVIRDGESSKLEEGERIEQRHAILRKIRARLSQQKGEKIPKGLLATGLLAMMALLFAAQAAMAIVEQGAVLQWWCSCNWWMHLWYITVTVTSVTESWTNLPFAKQWKIHISKPPYDLQVQDGEPVTTGFRNENEVSDAVETRVAIALSQLATLSPGTVSFRGSSEFTEYRNAMIVIVSVAADERIAYTWKRFWRFVSRVASVTVFVIGTSLFSNVTLLSLPMAQFVLILVLATGILGRAICGGIVSSVAQTEPMLHIITDSEQEACRVIGDIFNMGKDNEGERNMFQIEIEGHVFVSERRVAHRSKWLIKIFGVMANPFDIRKAARLGAQSEQLSGNEISEEPQDGGKAIV